MTSPETTQVRLVRCPKCQKVLPELPQNPVYMCGGCGTVLQAKKSKSGRSVRTNWSIRKTQLELDSEDVKSTTSVGIENHCDTKEFSSNLNVKEQIESTDCSIEPSGSRNSLNGVSSGELKCLSDMNAKEQIESTDCSIEPSGSGNLLNGVSLGESECLSDPNAKDQLENQLEHDSENVKATSSGQIENHCDTKECPSNLSAKEQIESTDSSIKQSESWQFLDGVSLGDSEFSSDLNAKEQIGSSDCSIEPSGRWKFLSGVSSGDSLDLDNGKEQIESIDRSIKRTGSTSFLEEVASGDFSNHRQRKEKSSEAGRNTHVDENVESQSPETNLSSRGKSSSFTVQRQSDESNPMKMSFSSSNKQLQQSYGISHQESDPTKSIETVEELSDTPRDISKSPSARSSHDYHHSVSSWDGWDDQVPEQPPNLPKRSLFKCQVITDFASNGPEVQHKPRKFLSMSSDEEHRLDVIDGLKWEGSRIQAQGQVGSPESDDHHPIKNWVRPVRDDGFLSSELSLRGFPIVYENGSPLNYGDEEFSCKKSACSSSKVDYSEKMELLRKVEELRDRLSRSYNQREMVNDGRFSARGTQQEKKQPLYYNYGQLDAKVPHGYDANYHKHPHVSFTERKNGYQKSEFSQMHFSGQGRNCRNHATDYSCDHCCPEDWQGQTQLPPSSTFHKGPSRVHSGPMFYGPYRSSSTTQQKYMASYLSLQGHMTRLDDQGHMVHDVQKKYYWDRHQPVKRHCRPIAGGAPFIICYRCCKLLQLPEDFISQKRVHWLKCSACSQVLKFSLQNGTHIIPYKPNPEEPLYHGSAQGEPESYSEDRGPSMRKSCSVQSDPVFPTLQGNADNKEQPSRSYSEANLKRKNSSFLRRSRNYSKTSKEASESASASSNLAKPESSSMEGEVSRRRRRSSLHRLMGYSSFSQIING